MFIDARNLPHDQHIQADVCIVGAGAAGITLARYLENSSLDVLLLESGGFDLEGATQSLYQTASTGLKYYDMAACRLRYFGGTTNHWAGYCLPYTNNAFDGRPELGVPPWPVREDEIKPYIDRAIQDLGLNPEGFSPAYQARQMGIDPKQLPDHQSSELVTQVYQITKRARQGKIWREGLSKQRNLRVMLHANVVRINADKTGSHIESVAVRAVGKDPFVVKARWFILAAHAVENARLLLDSDDVIPTGIGNQHDHVGRYFMEHPKIISGRFIPNKSFLPLYNAGTTHQVMRNVNLSLSPQTTRREGILDYYCRFLPAFEYERTHEAVKQLKESFWKPADTRGLKALSRVVGDIPSSYQYLLSRLNIHPTEFSSFNLDHRIEQAPNADSRITLSKDRDALGCRKVILNWALTDLDFKTYAVGQSILTREIKRLNLGTVIAPPLVPDAIKSLVKGNNHHIGTVRMSAHPKDGVVDKNLKVHGIDNLYVTGSAVFPNGGHAVPTMIIMSFAIRLAEHLSKLKKISA